MTGANRLVDGGDGGDTYNYSPPDDDTVVDRPTAVRVETTERGPVRARVLVVATYELPRHAVGDERSCSRRSDETELVEVRTTLELRAGERFLRIHAELDNRCRDHRLRAHFPLPAPVDGSDAECAFAVVHRGLTAEGGPNEVGLPTFVSRRFVDCSDGEQGLALLHDGLLEYEVVDTSDGPGRELALTLLRATGYLSRSELSLRPNPAGPLDPLEGPQLQGRHAVDYAVLPHRGTWRDADLHAAADALLVPLERVRAGGMQRSVPAHGSCTARRGRRGLGRAARRRPARGARVQRVRWSLDRADHRRRRRRDRRGRRPPRPHRRAVPGLARAATVADRHGAARLAAHPGAKTSTGSSKPRSDTGPSPTAAPPSTSSR